MANGHNLFNELLSELENLTDHKNDSLKNTEKKDLE